ncbi:MAG: peroxide stress protein YaaA [Actinomycetota bacterium]|nr:peroxide stress protein YaaA [Actinomycetota bacterium]
MSGLHILLPPSEGKELGGDGPSIVEAGSTFDDELGDARRTVREALVAVLEAAPDAVASKLLGVKGDALERAREADLSVAVAPTLPAIERYTGVLYDHLDHATLPERAREAAAGSVVIFSGLWGLVTPGDPIPDYRLKMGANLAPLGKVSTWWRPRLSPVLDARVRDGVVWDLLPQEHSAAWTSAGGWRARITVRFLDQREGPDGPKLVTVSHWSKALKGALARHLLLTGLTDPAGLVDFDHPAGYRFRPDLSTLDPDGGEAVFVKPPD